MLRVAGVAVLALAAATPAAEVQQLVDQGKINDAAQRVQTLLKQSPQDVQLRFLQGVIAAEQQKYDQAIQVFTALTRDHPQLPEPYNNLAVLHAAKGEDRLLLDRVEAALERLGGPPRDLPYGPIHADFFPDNVLFEGERVSGVIDFYYGCTDALAYDLAIALSAWGFDAEGEVQPHAIAAFRRGYQSVRPLTSAEAEALPRLGEAAALRFTLTRLHDRIFHDPSKLVTPKDPAVFLRRLDGWRALEAVA